MSRRYSLAKSFNFAFRGIRAALRKEPNFRLHLSLAVVVLVAAFLLRFSKLEWLVLSLTISFVLSLELINTALEEIIDLVSPEEKPAARTAKDVSAAAVLLAAALSIVVGLVLFLPKIL